MIEGVRSPASRARGIAGSGKLTALILLLLLVPITSYDVAIAGYVVLLLLFLPSFQVEANRYVVVLTLLMVFLAVASTTRFLLVPETTLRDFTEIGRPLPLLVLFLFLHKLKGLEARHLVHAALLYLTLDASLSLAQFLGLGVGPLEPVLGIYHSDFHASIDGWRALGLSAGPGQHGAIGLFLFCTMLGAAIEVPGVRTRSLVGAALGLFVIVLSGSRTALAAGAAVFPIALLASFRERRSARMMVLVVAAGTGALTFAFATQAALRSRAATILGLFTGGTVSAFDARQRHWEALFTEMLREPLWVAVGWGKSYFGTMSQWADNDWLLLLMVGGAPLVLGLLVAAGWLIGHAAWVLWTRKRIPRPFSLMSILTLCAGLISMSTAAFVSHPQVLMMLGLVIAGKYHEDRPPRSSSTDPARSISSGAPVGVGNTVS